MTSYVSAQEAADFMKTQVPKAACRLWQHINEGRNVRIVERRRDGFYRVTAISMKDVNTPNGYKGSGKVRSSASVERYSRGSVEALVRLGLCYVFQYDDEMRPLLVLAQRRFE